MGGRTIAAVFAGRPVQGRFHAGEDLAAELAAAGGIECDGCASGDECLGEVLHEGGRRGVADVDRTLCLEQVRLLLLAAMFTSWMPSERQIRLSIWPGFEAAAVCTRALCPSSRMVSTMPAR